MMTLANGKIITKKIETIGSQVANNENKAFIAPMIAMSDKFAVSDFLFKIFIYQF